jgi:putative redox protein
VTSVRHVARATGSTSTTSTPYRVELRAGQHPLLADEPTAGGGADAGPSPFGLVLSGLAACTAMTLRMYADRKGWTLERVDVDVRYDVDDGGNGSIARTITFRADLPVEQRDRLADIAERTPVTLAIRNGIAITTTVRSVDDM